MQLAPVVADAAAVVAAVGGSCGERLTLRGELDVDVYRLGRPQAPDLVVRAFGPEVSAGTVAAAAQVLTTLGATRFPAERCPTTSPVVTIDDGCHLLVTEYVDPSPAPHQSFVLAWCAALLGRLAGRPGEHLPAGGGWHRLGPTPTAEIDEALRLGGAVGVSLAAPVDALAEMDDGAGLPEALIHADLTPPNAVARGGEPPVIIDWVGVGRGPRVWPLAFLLFVAGPARAPRALARYERSTPLTDEERHRIPAMLAARPIALDLWSVSHERMTAGRAVRRYRSHRTRAAAVAAALAESRPDPADGRS